MDRRRIFLTSLVVLVATGSCFLVIRLPSLQESVREGLIMPVVYLVWLARLLIHSLDQPVLWGGAMFIFAFAVLYGLLSAWPDVPPLLRRGLRTTTARTYSEEEQPPPVSGRVDYWEGKILSLRNQGVDSDYANYEFRRLARSAAEIIARGNGSADPPQAIQVFFQPLGSASVDAKPISRRRWARYFKPSQSPPPVDPLVGLCKYLENQLESNHDIDD